MPWIDNINRGRHRARVTAAVQSNVHDGYKRAGNFKDLSRLGIFGNQFFSYRISDTLHPQPKSRSLEARGIQLTVKGVGVMVMFQLFHPACVGGDRSHIPCREFAKGNCVFGDRCRPQGAGLGGGSWTCWHVQGIPTPQTFKPKLALSINLRCVSNGRHPHLHWLDLYHGHGFCFPKPWYRRRQALYDLENKQTWSPASCMKPDTQKVQMLVYGRGLQRQTSPHVSLRPLCLGSWEHRRRE